MTLLAATFLAGLAGSPHCAGMCGPFAASCAKSVQHALAYHAGRLFTYGALGAAAGLLGSTLPLPTTALAWLAALLTVVFAASLAGLIHLPAIPVPGVSRLASAALRRTDAPGALVLGATSALLPCGLVYTALAVPIVLEDPALGAAAMVAFGAGTTPLLAASSLGLRRLASHRPWTRRVLAAVVLASGLYTVAMRNTLAPAEQAVGEPVCH